MRRKYFIELSYFINQIDHTKLQIKAEMSLLMKNMINLILSVKIRTKSLTFHQTDPRTLTVSSVGRVVYVHGAFCSTAHGIRLLSVTYKQNETEKSIGRDRSSITELALNTLFCQLPWIEDFFFCLKMQMKV